jgi:diadenosine tetraphosphatase ApaH/serine/threonine PP2A family protein phosphatase
VCLFGHTHVQVGHYLSKEQFGLATPDDQRPLTIAIEDANRYLINPGSVGQPRDGDPRAAFATVDTAAREITIYRVEYPIAEAQARIVAEGLPEVLAQRLALGR